MNVLGLDNYHKPVRCSKCGGKMIFKGVGEYSCEDCQSVEYDDYGKVRLYVEKHKGANITEIEKATGVTQRSIRMMVKEERFEVCNENSSFVRCEMCGKPIRSGRLCVECENLSHRAAEHMNRKKKADNVQGYGMQNLKDEKGEKRFRREDR